MGRIPERHRSIRSGPPASKAKIARRTQRRWTQQLVCDELRRLAAERVPLRPEAIRTCSPALSGAIRRHFGDFRTALFAASLEGAAAATATKPLSKLRYRSPPARRWSKKAICEELRRLADADVRMSSNAVRRHDPGLVSAISLYFPGFPAARLAAGLERPPPPDQRKWRPESIEAALRQWVEMHGALDATGIKNHSYGLMRAVERTFGNVRKAAQALGLPFRDRQWNWSRSVVCEELRKLAASEPHLSLVTVRDRHSSNLVSAIYRYFSDFSSALLAAGLDPLPPGPRRWKPEVLETALCKWVKKNGPLIHARLLETDPALLKAVRARYGTVARAGEALRLPHRALRTTWDQAAICDALRRLARERVHLSAGNVGRLDSSLHSAIHRRFGSFDAALFAASLSSAHPARPQLSSRKRCAEALGLWVERDGVLSAAALARRDSELLAATKRHFGSLFQAARQLRLPYKRR